MLSATFGDWQSAVGYRLLAIGCWQLAPIGQEADAKLNCLGIFAHGIRPHFV